MRVVLSHTSKKQYDKLPPPEKNKIKKKLLFLEENPVSGKKLSGELSLYRSLKVWPYRIIYWINDKEKIIGVADIEHRQGVYK